MADVGFWEGIGRNLSGRGMFGGKFQLRLILQPLAAILLGLRLGIHDAKAGRPPFLPELAGAKGGRAKVVGRTVRDTIIPFTLALLIDSILQYLINHRVRPLAALIVGTLLVYLPFMLSRGFANRIWTNGHGGSQATHAP